MLFIRILNERQHEQYAHAEGVLQIGRGPTRPGPRRVVRDDFVSRDQLLIEEMPGGNVRLENVSQRRHIDLGDGRKLLTGQSVEVPVPVYLRVGRTDIEIEAETSNDVDTQSLYSLARPQTIGGTPASAGLITQLGEAPKAEMLATWLETLVHLQRHDADEQDTYRSASRALVELIGLDLGMVLLRHGQDWNVAASYTTSDRASLRWSRTLVQTVVSERRTFYQDVASLPLQAQSLTALDAVVASPIFDLRDEVAGVLYGVRTRPVVGRTSIRPLEAQVVQLLAAAVGSSLTRASALRTRVQFEQFFSSELVRELENNPDLLEGRNQEVTILVSDLRDSVRLAERLTPATSCQLIRDLMERLTTCICDQGGVVVDYAGDGILAMWNAPLPQVDHAARACRAALAMQAEMPAINQEWGEKVGFPLRLGIGLNTGEAQVGNTGSTRKLKYGPHGQTVNCASRVQAATKNLKAGILLTESTQTQVRGLFQTRSWPAQQLTGLGTVTLHELLGEQNMQVLA